MSEPPPTTPKTVVIHFLSGAIPAALAIVLTLWQTLHPFASHQHRGMLYILLLAGFIAPMAVTVWCKVDHSRRQTAAAEEAAAERDRVLNDKVDALTQFVHKHDGDVECRFGQLSRSMSGVHQHLAKHDEALAGNKEALAESKAEIEHIRNLILENDPPQFTQQRLGPRSLS